ncbi:MAG TPA: diacylglycerol kinase family protein [Myxococcaceae bacterium]|nr:diacylglycerol kinase family protein [Myxococcaceae bacterium]
MLVHPARASVQNFVPALQPASEPRVAIVVNANARQVTPKIIRALSHAVAEEDLFVTHSPMQVRRIAKTLLERRYPIVFCGGGDGTFAALVNEVFHQLEQNGVRPARRAPRFGILKLGTGNGLAALVHASTARGDRMLEDVLRAKAGETAGVRRLDLLLVEGRRTPFAGLGADGRLLNDFVWVRDHLAKGMFKGLLSGTGGYVSAAALKTLPHYLVHPAAVECEVLNGLTSAAYRLGPNGSVLGEPIAPGAPLFRGRLMIAAAATIPFYGFGLKMFPFAGQRPGMMHLRLGAASPPAILANLPALWKGRWFPRGIQDFHAKEVVIRFEKPMPLQVSGDAEGYRAEICFGIATGQVELLDFNGILN